MWCVSVLASVWLMLISAHTAVGQTQSFTLGDENVSIPCPEGFFRIDGQSEEFDRFTHATIPSTSRLLVVYGSEVDLANLMLGDFPACDRTFSVDVVRRLENKDYSRQDFKKLAVGLREFISKQQRDNPELHATLKKIEERASKELSGQVDGNVDFVLSDLTPLGIFEETNNSILTTSLVKLSVDSEDVETVDDVLVSASGLVLVNSRLINLKVTSIYETSDDIAWSRASLRTWRDRIVAANSHAPDVSLNTTSPSSNLQSLPFDDPPLLILTILVSFVITWSIGLAPPLLIRYAFLRRPLSNKAATWIAIGFSVLFWFSFLLLNLALGQEPGRGIVWVVVFFVSRWLMSRGYVAPTESKQ